MLKPLVKLGFGELVISDRETLKKRKKYAFFYIRQRNSIKFRYFMARQNF